jgi:Fur family peroxide stress response transcriptional regulator
MSLGNCDVTRLPSNYLELSLKRCHHILANQGIVRRLEIGESARYDADLGDHDHIRCISCGKVDDLDKLPARLKKDMINKQSQYRILGIRIDIFGLCPECIRMENTT